MGCLEKLDGNSDGICLSVSLSLHCLSIREMLFLSPKIKIVLQGG